METCSAHHSVRNKNTNICQVHLLSSCFKGFKQSIKTAGRSLEIYLQIDHAEDPVILEEKDFRQRSWNHMCWLFQDGMNQLYINSLLFLKFQNPNQKGKLAFQATENVFSSAFIIGQEQDTVGGTFSEKQIYQGHLTELNIWKSLLEEKDIKSLANCDMYSKGDLFSWEKNNLKLFGNARFDPVFDLKRLCDEKLLFMFPWKTPLAESLLLCSSLGGNISLPNSEDENTEVMNVFEEYVDQCSDNSNIAIWIGLEKIPENEDWNRVGNTTDIRGIKYSPSNSLINFYENYNCIYMMNNGGWKSFQDCNLITNSLAACTICEFRDTPMLGLKGACETQGSPNWNYYLSKNGTNEYYFEGYKRDLIKQSESGWIIEKQSGEVFGRLTENGQNGPIGRNTWELSKRGRNLCLPMKGFDRQLTLSTCGLDQFTCDSGHCINIYRRCDDVKDCEDDSDEMDCEIVYVPENYKKEPTKRLDDSINYIYTKVTILKFDSIDKSGVLDITLTIQMRWRDPRLTYLNIMDEGQTGGGYEKDISVEKQADLWLPLDNIVQRNAVIGDVLQETITFVRVIVGDNATAPLPKNAVEGKLRCS